MKVISKVPNLTVSEVDSSDDLKNGTVVVKQLDDEEMPECLGEPHCVVEKSWASHSAECPAKGSFTIPARSQGRFQMLEDGSTRAEFLPIGSRTH